MKGEIRRNKILKTLNENNLVPVSASKLAAELDVSRQVIVGDIALIRAGGVEISATPRGYVLVTTSDKGYQGVVASKHYKDMLFEELFLVVDNGGCVIDVIVEHELYGEIKVDLYICSRYDVNEFKKKYESVKSKPLHELTDGVHYHTIACASKEVFDRIKDVLEEKGLIYKEN